MPQPPTNRGQAIDGHLSYWVKSAEAERHPPLQLDAACDVVVVGAGIVGVTCAFKLARSGARVILLEARRIGSGTTGYTTAKISSLHGLTYSKLESSLGAEEARIYAEANEAGLAEIGSLVEELTTSGASPTSPTPSATNDPPRSPTRWMPRSEPDSPRSSWRRCPSFPTG